MKKILAATGFMTVIAACNNQPNKPKVDTTPVLSQTNNSFPMPVDTIGFTTDAATRKYEKGSILIAKSDCLSCHKIKEKVVGPAYVAVAAKYPATNQNIQYLSAKIINGGKGVWGDVSMTPHSNVSPADATEMAKYVLSLKGVQ